VDEAPLADGGEGLVEALVRAGHGEFVGAEVTDPLGRPITARYGMLPDGTGVIEMAAASGLPLLSRAERDPMKATTYGTGQLLKDALDRGTKRVVLGIGGSATVDGGTGMAEALGARFLDADGNMLGGGGEILSRIVRIDMSGLDRRVKDVSITVACDVTNPLTGPTGAAVVYGPQKGATPEQVKVLDAGLANLARIVRVQLGLEVETIPGAGAAGGLGAGLMAFLGARLERGIEIVRRAVGLDARVAGADLVLTGEGRADGQSAYGKVVSGVADAAKAAHVPVILLAGSIGDGADALYERGVSAVFSIARGPASEAEMMRGAAALLASAAEGAVRAFLAGRERRR
jgi:glycerate kinase